MLELRSVADVAKPLTGDIALVERVQGFAGNECFRLLSESGETFYLKSGATSAVRAEAWACDQARQVGVLAPEVLTTALQPADLPSAYLIERAVPGEPISPSSEDILEAVGEQLRRLHDLKGTSYGFLHRELKQTWTEVIRQPFDRVGELVAADVMPTEVAEQLSALDPLDAR